MPPRCGQARKIPPRGETFPGRGRDRYDMDGRPGDETLLLAVAERDMGAFRTLYERHAGGSRSGSPGGATTATSWRTRSGTLSWRSGRDRRASAATATRGVGGGSRYQALARRSPGSRQLALCAIAVLVAGPARGRGAGTHPDRPCPGHHGSGGPDDAVLPWFIQAVVLDWPGSGRRSWASAAWRSWWAAAVRVPGGGHRALADLLRAARRGCGVHPRRPASLVGDVTPTGPAGPPRSAPWRCLARRNGRGGRRRGRLVLMAPSLVPQVARWVRTFPAPGASGPSSESRVVDRARGVRGGHRHLDRRPKPAPVDVQCSVIPATTA